MEGGGGGGSTLELTFCRHPSRVSCLAVEGDLAVSGDLNGTLIVWQWRTGEVVTEKVKERKKLYKFASRC